MRRPIAVLAGLLLVMVAVPSAQAHNVAGASGGCDDDDTSYTAGNTFEDDEADLGVNQDGSNTDLPDVVDTAQAVGNLAEGFAGDGNPPSNACDGTGSWLAVYAAGDFAVCYDGAVWTDTSTGGGYSTFNNPNNECHHHDGAGNSNSAVTGDDDGDLENDGTFDNLLGLDNSPVDNDDDPGA